MYKLIKILSILFLMFGIGIVANTQTCYIQSENNQNFDMTGYKLSGTELADINALCCSIGDLLPNDLKRDFKIYDFGLYKHNKSMEGGYDAAWSEALSIVNATPYYLVFGRMDDNKQYKVALRLPTTAFFECQSADKIKNLEAILEAMANENASSFAEYYTSEAKVLNHLKDSFAKWKDCCVTGNRNPSCSPCEELKNIKIRLAKEGFREQPCKFVSNTGNSGRSGSRNSTTDGETNMIVNLNGADVQLNADLLGQFAQFEDLGIASSYGYIASDKYFCDVNNQTKFDAAFNTFNANTSKLKVMYIVVDDPESTNDFLYEKIIGMDNLSDAMSEAWDGLLESKAPWECKQRCRGVSGMNIVTNWSLGDYPSPEDSQENIRKGRKAHFLIQSFYAGFYNDQCDSIFFEYCIPKTSKKNSENDGFCDIYNKTFNQMWEIKSVAGAITYGVPEIDNYVKKFNLFCKSENDADVEKGKTFIYEPMIFPFEKKDLIKVYIPHQNSNKTVTFAGVISYEIFKGGNKPWEWALLLKPLDRYFHLMDKMKISDDKSYQHQKIAEHVIKEPADYHNFVQISSAICVLGGTAAIIAARVKRPEIAITSLKLAQLSLVVLMYLSTH